MKQIRFILLALITTLLLVACERPAPAGEIPSPAENSTDIVPRTDEAYPPPSTGETVTEPAVSPDADVPDTSTENTETQPAENEATAPVDNTGTEATETEETSDQSSTLIDGVYTVRSGDTLGQIAFAYGISVEDLMAANNLTNPDILDVGQQLTIPEAGFAETADTSAEAPPAGTTGEEQVHIVQAGDNLYRIGLRYGFTVDELAAHNNLTNVNNLEVGQEIRIPPSN